METVNKLEKFMADLLKKLNLPKLPKGFTDWLVENVWWIALVGAILTGLGALALLGTVSASLALSTAFGGLVFVGATLVGVALVGGLVSLAITIVEVIILAKAVKPLQDRKIEGWNLLFLGFLLGVAMTAVDLVFKLLGLNILGFISAAVWGVLWTAAYAYLLFGIKYGFGGKKIDAGTVKTESTEQ